MHRSLRWMDGAAIVAIAVSVATGETAQTRGVVLDNVRIIDGSGATPIENGLQRARCGRCGRVRWRCLAAGGYGAYRQILPLSRQRDRADGRVDHELTARDSIFTRFSWQRRDPDAFTFESTGGNGSAGLTNLGLLDRRSKAITLAAVA